MAEPTVEELQAQLHAAIAERDAIKANRDEALAEAKRAKAALKAYDGVDPQKFKELSEAAQKAEEEAARKSGNWDAQKAQMTAAHQKELAAATAGRDKLSKALERRLVDAELTRAIAAKKGDPDLLLPYARQFVRVKETDDDYEGYIADERGNPLIADGKGTPMTFDSFVEQNLMSKFPRAFEGSGSSGGGAAKSSAGGGGVMRSIPAGDNRAFLQNLEGIAKGTVTVDA